MKRPAQRQIVLEAFRLRHGLTQERAAELLPCSLRTWQRWEAGAKPPEYLWRALAHLQGELWKGKYDDK